MKEINPFIRMMQDLTKSQKALVNSNLINKLTPMINSMPKVDYLKSVLPHASLLSAVIPANQLKHFSPELSLIAQTYRNNNIEKYISPYMNVISTVISDVQMKSIFPVMNSLSKAFALNQIKAITPAIISTSNIIPLIQKNPIFPDVSAINNLIKKSNASIITYNDLISAGIITKLNQSSYDDILLSIDQINHNFEEAKKDKLSFEFFINLCLTLSLFIYNQYSSDKDNREIIYTVKESETKILTEIKKIPDLQIVVQYYVILRQCYAYTYPSTEKTKIKTILYPNQKVRINERRSKWIYIEYFNYLKNQHEQAWCKKKYSRLIKMK